MSRTDHGRPHLLQQKRHVQKCLWCKQVIDPKSTEAKHECPAHPGDVPLHRVKIGEKATPTKTEGRDAAKKEHTRKTRKTASRA